MSDSKLSGALPKGEADGLSHIAAQLLDRPRQFRVILAIIDCKNSQTDYDTGEVVPVARIRRVEVILATDLPVAEQLMRRSLEARSGRTVLPLDLEDDVAIAFRHVDPDTGERRDDGG